MTYKNLLLLLLIPNALVGAQEADVKVTAEQFPLGKTQKKYHPQKVSRLRATRRACGRDFWVEKTNYMYFAEGEAPEKMDGTIQYDPKATEKPQWRITYKDIYESLHAALKKEEENLQKASAKK